MADPVAVFQYRYQLFQVRNPDLYGLQPDGNPQPGPFSVSDSSNSASDNTAKLGDVQPDTFSVTSGSGGVNTYSYIGTRTTGSTDTSGGDGIFATLNGTTYLLTNTPTQPGQMYVYASPNTVYDIPCYASGTKILTCRGEITVEDLQVGEAVVTAGGEHRSIRWIGSRTMDCARHSPSADVQPVRICAGALGENRPVRDLVVSPGHSICLDVLGEVLIPASALINGTTITQQNVETVTYWHVELDSHDILLAEGQPAESYLDMGNRNFFRDTDVVNLGATPDGDTAARTHADYCRPFIDGGVVLDAIRAQVQVRAERLGWRLNDEPWADMHLMVDGERIDADTLGLTARFVLPASAKDVWLISETSAPREIGLGADQRRLGLCLRAMAIDDGVSDKRSVALDDPLLCLGFHDYEECAQRWTAGRSRLTAALFAGCRGTVFLHLELVRHALPRWIAPKVAIVDETTHEAPHLSLVA